MEDSFITQNLKNAGGSFDCGHTGDAEILEKTIILNSVAAGIFGLAFLFALFIQVRYLII